MSTIARALYHAGQQLLFSGLVADRAEAHLEAEVLLRHMLGLDRAGLYARLPEPLSPEGMNAYTALLARRLAGEPVAYIIGQREFYGLSFYVDRRVFIPRPETELLVERTLHYCQNGGDTCGRSNTGDTWDRSSGQGLCLADVGCGSGCIAVTLAVHLPKARIYAIDISGDALAVAALNARRHGVAERVTFLQGDLLKPLPEPVDIIVANLPYVSHPQLAGLPKGITAYEPLIALNGGPDGLSLIRNLLQQAGAYLRQEGNRLKALFLEIGSDQARAVTTLASEFFPLARINLYHDLAGHPRVLEVLPTAAKDGIIIQVPPITGETPSV